MAVVTVVPGAAIVRLLARGPGGAKHLTVGFSELVGKYWWKEEPTPDRGELLDDFCVMTEPTQLARMAKILHEVSERNLFMCVWELLAWEHDRGQAWPYKGVRRREVITTTVNLLVWDSQDQIWPKRRDGRL